MTRAHQELDQIPGTIATAQRCEACNALGGCHQHAPMTEGTMIGCQYCTYEALAAADDEILTAAQAAHRCADHMIDLIDDFGCSKCDEHELRSNSSWE